MAVDDDHTAADDAAEPADTGVSDGAGASAAEALLASAQRVTTQRRSALLDQVLQTRVRQRAAEADQLRIVSDLCDAYATIPDTTDTTDDEAVSAGRPGPKVLFGEKLRTGARDGLPQVAESLGHELGPVLGVSPISAWSLIWDVLALRERHPVLWSLTLQQEVPAWRARKVATACAHLTFEAARQLDSELAPRMVAWGPTRTMSEVARAAIRLDPQAEEDRQAATRARSVEFSPHDTAPGITHLFARLDALDAHHLSGTLNGIADTLRKGGATETKDELRAIALGHLAHPERAAQLLSEDLFTAGAAVTPDGTIVHTGTGELIPTTTGCGGMPGASGTGPGGCGTAPGSAGAWPGGGRAGRTTPDDSRPSGAGAASTWPGGGQPGGDGAGGGTVAGRRVRPCQHGAEIVLHLSSRDLASGTSGGDAVGIGPITRKHLADLLTSCAGKVTVRPVVDLAAPMVVSQYRPSAGMRWVILTRDRTEAYPWSERSAFSTRVDLDHTVPYNHENPAAGGPTCTSNLAAWSRLTHRLKTHAGYQVEQESPGVLRWTTPTGRIYWATPHGTYNHPPPDTISN